MGLNLIQGMCHHPRVRVTGRETLTRGSHTAGRERRRGRGRPTRSCPRGSLSLDSKLCRCTRVRFTLGSNMGGERARFEADCVKGGLNCGASGADDLNRVPGTLRSNGHRMGRVDGTLARGVFPVRNHSAG